MICRAGKRTEYFSAITDLFSFCTQTDPEGNEYVLFSREASDDPLGSISDKTAFEAFVNHVHLLENVKAHEFEPLLTIGRQLTQAILYCLKFQYPDKSFCVFATVSLRDSFIIRFHQKWEGEAIYFDMERACTGHDRVIMAEG